MHFIFFKFKGFIIKLLICQKSFKKKIYYSHHIDDLNKYRIFLSI